MRSVKTDRFYTGLQQYEVQLVRTPAYSIHPRMDTLIQLHGASRILIVPGSNKEKGLKREVYELHSQ